MLESTRKTPEGFDHKAQPKHDDDLAASIIIQAAWRGRHTRNKCKEIQVEVRWMRMYNQYIHHNNSLLLHLICRFTTHLNISPHTPYPHHCCTSNNCTRPLLRHARRATPSRSWKLSRRRWSKVGWMDGSRSTGMPAWRLMFRCRILR